MNASNCRRWLALILLGIAFNHGVTRAYSQETPPKAGLGQPIPIFEGTTASSDPIDNVPNFLGHFYGRGIGGSQRVNTLTTETFTFTGRASDTAGIPPNVIFFSPTINGPGGPYAISSNVTGKVSVPPNAILDQNTELTGLIQAKIPGATFANGIGNSSNGTVLFNYLRTLGADFTVVAGLPNPSGGGLVGRNNYFDNGSPIPQDRVYFFYNHVGSYQGLGTPFDINRYVFGFEKTFLDGIFSLELRLPFAGTASSDQVAGESLLVNHPEFGNIGIVLKSALYRTPNLLICAGLGISVPTADSSRMLVNGQTVIEIQNQAVLLQPIFGVAWAPSDRVYGQLGVQFDFDPSTNPVYTIDTSGNPYRAGALRDYSFAYVGGAAGWWAYRNDTATLTGIALQGELHFDAAMGPQHVVRDGNIVVADFTNRTLFTGTAGFIAAFGPRAYLSLGVNFPLTGDRLYDWNLIAQLNYRFGPRP